MHPVSFQLKAYLKVGCPYSFKFLLFMSEAGILDEVDVIRCDPKQSDFQALKARLSQGLGEQATFPTVEVEPNRYLADSDELIKFFAKKCGVTSYELPALAFYEDSIMPQVVELHEQQGH